MSKILQSRYINGVMIDILSIDGEFQVREHVILGNISVRHYVTEEKARAYYNYLCRKARRS